MQKASIRRLFLIKYTMFITTEQTPNPNTLKFGVGKEVRGDATPLFFKKDTANNPKAKAPIVEALFKIDDIESVFFGSDFITVGKNENTEWWIVKPDILGTIMDHSDEPYVTEVEPFENKLDHEPDKEQLEINTKIKDLLDQKVRPAVALDGGDIIFHSYQQGTVYLEMHGSCAGCPSSTATLKAGIENMMKHYIPEVHSVEAVG